MTQRNEKQEKRTVPASSLKRKLAEYGSLTTKVRELSSPQVAEIGSPEEYRRILLRNFARIGELADRNNEILRRYWFPLVNGSDPLTTEEVDALDTFSETLLNARRMDNLDAPMRYLQTTRMLEDADRKKDEARIIRMLDRHIETAFAMMHMTQRTAMCSNISLSYREAGLLSGERILSYLPHGPFAALRDDESREMVLVNSRYISALFDRYDNRGDEAVNQGDLDFLLRALRLSDDDFYVTLMPSYNWVYHRFRALQYITQLLFNGNERGMTPRQCETIHTCAEMLNDLWNANRETLAAYTTQDFLDLHLMKASYFSGRISPAAYKNKLLRLYAKCDDNDFSFFNSSLFSLIPSELFLLAGNDGIAPEDESGVSLYYQRLISYIHRMPKKGSLSFLLTYLCDIVFSFKQVKGSIDFETLCLSLMAALHPPTYVHTLSVTDFSVCLCRHLLHARPDLFTSFCGVTSPEDVLSKEKEILDFTKHASLCHDIGKLFIAEVIMTYGRKLFDEEFDLIRMHPEVGACLLGMHEDTKQYAQIARFHHIWYDGSAGYPLKEGTGDLPEKVFIDIIACADCLDAATDDVGRSYKKGKSLDEYISEIHEGAGTRYAPYLAGLLADRNVRADVERILSIGRDENYRKAYQLIKMHGDAPGIR